MIDALMRPFKWLYFFMKVDPDLLVTVVKMTAQNHSDIQKLAEVTRSVAESSIQTNDQVQTIIRSGTNPAPRSAKNKEDVFH